MTELLRDLRALAPNRPLSYGESLQVARLQAARLRTWIGADEPDINLAWLVNQRAVPVHFVPGYKLGEESGLTTNAVGGKVQIFINEAEPDVRQRFSLLHEFKHLIDFDDAEKLHERLGSGNERRRNLQVELVCNEFAAQVLMPVQLVKRVWFRTQQLELAAGQFNVSPEAMRTRLVKLGLLDRPEPQTKTYFRSAGLSMAT
jgi:hypothetical protein